MALEDRCCTLVPYFKVHEGQLAAFKALCEQFVARTAEEEKVMFYGFSFDGENAHCHEAYADAAGLLAHLDNGGEPPAGFDPRFCNLDYGFRR